MVNNPLKKPKMVTFSYNTIKLPQPATLLTTITSVATTAYLVCTLANEYIPETIQSYFGTHFRNFTNYWSTQVIMIIEEYNGITPNHMFEAANDYLGYKLDQNSRSRRISVNKGVKESDIKFGVDFDEEIKDFFQRVEVSWRLGYRDRPPVVSGSGSRRNDDGDVGGKSSEVRIFEVRFHKKYMNLVLQRYLGYVLTEAKMIAESRKEIKLHTLEYSGSNWSGVKMDHPATFDKIAMDPDKKNELIKDLDKFISRRDYYRRVGKAWKRGYLLYGPPGTGKSSLIAAMANYLKFNVYDLDLREVGSNCDLRKLLIGTANKSILVIEDIDCSIELTNREDSEADQKSVDYDKVTLSAVLNFVDGLWSMCGDERIIVFTTNHKDRLDPALLRPGRMDVHIEMSYCTFSGFKLLASNYLGIEDHPLYNTIEDLLNKVQVTPAQVAGELMKSDLHDVALDKVYRLLIAANAKDEGFVLNFDC